MEQDETKSAQNTPTQQSIAKLIFVVGLLTCFLGIGLTGYITLYRNQVKTNALFMMSNKRNEQQYKALDAQLTQKISELEDQCTQNVNTLIEKIQSNADGKPALIKARYTLELAQINAYATTDYETTLSLLNKADELLSTENDPAIFPVRQAIAQEISELEAAKKTDTIGILSQLNAIGAAAKINNVPIQSIQNVHTESDSTIKSLFHQLIIIRHHDEPIEPLQSPAYKAILQEAIQLNLQEAKWAVIQKNDTIYQLALNEAIHNSSQIISDPALVKSLEELKTIQLEQPKIIPKESLTLLMSVMSTAQGVTAP